MISIGIRCIILGNDGYSFCLSCSITALSLNSDILWQNETKSNQTPILISPAPARSFWDVWLSSSPPRRLLFQPFARVPLDRPSPFAASGSRPTDRGRAEGGRPRRCRRAVGGGRSKEPRQAVGAHPAFSLPLAPAAPARGVSGAFLPRKCVWLPRPWKRVISHPWGWQVPYLSVSLGRHLLVPLAVHGKVGCSKHTLGKPSLKHSEGLWFFLRCATSPGTAKGLLYRYHPVLRLRCTGGFARSLAVQTFLKQWNQ